MPGEFYIEGKKEKVDLSQILAKLADVLDRLGSIVVYRGETTAAGAADGSSLVCSELTTKPDYDGNEVVILSGDYAGQARDINGSTTGGTVSPLSAFDGQILAGVRFAILAVRTTPAEVAAIEAKLDNSTYGLAALNSDLDAIIIALTAVQTQTQKLHGETPGQGFTTANWQTTESDVASIGVADTRHKIHDLSLSIHNLVGTSITVRLYKSVNGTERQVYQQTFDATSDPPSLPIINGTWAIHDALRVTLQSNNAADNGQTVDYDYMLEAM